MECTLCEKSYTTKDNPPAIIISCGCVICKCCIDIGTGIQGFGTKVIYMPCPLCSSTFIYKNLYNSPNWIRLIPIQELREYKSKHLELIDLNQFAISKDAPFVPFTFDTAREIRRLEITGDSATVIVGKMNYNSLQIIGGTATYEIPADDSFFSNRTDVIDTLRCTITASNSKEEEKEEIISVANFRDFPIYGVFREIIIDAEIELYTGKWNEHTKIKNKNDR